MRSIAVMNQKGGTGKTTTAVNVSAALAEAGSKVCLIDIDPQANASLHLGIEPRDDLKSIYDVLVEHKELRDVRQQVADNLWIVPAHIDLSAAEMQLAGVFGREGILRNKLKSDDMKFDFVLIDCPPSIGILTINAITAVDEVFIAIQPHFFPMYGLGRQVNTIDLIADRLNNRLKISGAVYCMYDGQAKLTSEVEQTVDEFFRQKQFNLPVCSHFREFQTKIRRNIRLAEAPSFGMSIFQYAPTSNGAEDYRRLAEEIIVQGAVADVKGAA